MLYYEYKSTSNNSKIKANVINILLALTDETIIFLLTDGVQILCIKYFRSSLTFEQQTDQVDHLKKKIHKRNEGFKNNTLSVINSFSV